MRLDSVLPFPVLNVFPVSRESKRNRVRSITVVIFCSECLSRLKGMETAHDNLSAFRTCLVLNVFPDMKGMETVLCHVLDHQIQSSESVSRLKGMETLIRMRQC